MNLRDVFKEKIDQPESLVGAVYSDKGYLSTSRQRKKSVDFLSNIQVCGILQSNDLLKYGKRIHRHRRRRNS